MAILLWSLIAVIVCCQNLATVSHAEGVDPCTLYDEHFQCTPSKDNVPPLKDEPDCGTDIVQTTMNLLTEGDAVINKQLEELGNSTEAVLVLGKTGTGKSTLTFFLAGNTTALVSYQSCPMNRSIADCNGKTGRSGIVPQTTFPELVTDKTTHTSFYDYPGFVPTQAVCVEVANAYYMLKVAKIIPKAKFLLVVDFPTIGGNARADFVELLKSVINFIPNIEKFSSNLGLVATKVNDPKSKDIEFIKWIVKFLNEIQTDLNKSFEGEELRKATFIVETLLVEGRIGIFRTPDTCGPLDTIPLLQTNKRNLYEMISKNLSYVETKPNDFGLSLSQGNLFNITSLRVRFAEELLSTLQRLSNEVVSSLETQFDCQQSNSCGVLLENLHNLYNDQYYHDSYSTPGLYPNISATKTIHRVTAVYSSFLDNAIFENISESLTTLGKYLEFLHTLDNLETDIVPLLVPLKDLKAHVIQKISGLNSEFSTQVGQSLAFFTKELIAFFNREFTCFDTLLRYSTDCDTLFVSLIEVNTNDDLLNGYAIDDSWSQLSFAKVVNRLTDLLTSEFDESDHIVAFKVSKEVAEALQTYSKHLDNLHSIVGALTVDIDSWLSPFQAMTITLKTNSRTFASNVEQALTTSLVSYSTDLGANTFAKFNCLESLKCETLLQTLNDLYQNFDYVSGYTNNGSWDGLSSNELVTRITNLSLVDYETNPAISESLDKHSDYIDHILAIESSATVDQEKWFESLRTFKSLVKAKIVSWNTELPSRIEQDLSAFTAELIKFFDSKFKCEDQSECYSLFDSLAGLYNNSDFFNAYTNDGSWEASSYSVIVSRLTDTSVFDFQVSSSISEALQQFSYYLDEIHLIEDLSPVNIATWLYQFQTMSTTVKSNTHSFASQQEQALTTTLASYSTDLGANAFPKFDCLDTLKCDVVLQDLNELYQNSDYVSEYKNDGSWDSLTCTQLVSRMTNLSLVDYETNPAISESLDKHSDFIDHILEIDSSISVNREKWFEALRVFKSMIKDKIIGWNTELPPRIGQDLSAFTSELNTFFASKFQCLDKSECNSLFDSLESLYNNSDFYNGYENDDSWDGLSYSVVVIRLTDTIVFDFQVSPKILEALLHFGNYLDEIHSIETLSAVNISAWLSPFQAMRITIKSNIRVFASDVEQALTTSLASYSTDLGENVFAKFSCLDAMKCDAVLQDLDELYHNSYFLSGYKNDGSWASLTSSELVSGITSLSIVDYQTNPKISASLKKYTDYIDHLLVIENSLIVEPEGWLESLRTFKSLIKGQLVSWNIEIPSRVVKNLSAFTSELIKFFDGKFKCIDESECKPLFDSLASLYKNTYFLSANEGSRAALSFSNIISQLIDFEVVEFQVSLSIPEALRHFSTYLDKIHSLEDLSPVNIVPWFYPFQSMAITIKTNVQTFVSNVEQVVITNVTSYSTGLSGNLVSKFDCLDTLKCDTVLQDLNKLYQNTDFVGGYKNNGSWDGLASTTLVSRMTSLILSGYQTNPAIFKSLEKHSDYIDQILQIDSTFIVDPEKWFESLRTLKSMIKDNLISWNTEVPSRIEQNVAAFTSELSQFFATKFKCLEQPECSPLFTSLAGLYSNSDFLSGYANDASLGALSFSNVIIRITGTKVPNFLVSTTISQALQQFSNYLDQIHSLEKLTTVNLVPWLYPLRSMKTTIKSNVTAFTSSVEKVLTTAITSYSTDLSANVLAKFSCLNTMQCDALLQNLNKLYQNSDFVGGYKNDGSWKSLTSSKLVSRMTELSLTGYQTNPTVAASLKKHSDYVDNILKIDSSISVDTERWFESLRTLEPTFKAKIQTAVKDKVSQLIVSSLNEAYLRAFNSANNKFNSFGDIVAKQKEIETYKALVNSKIATLTTKLQGNLNFYQYSEQAITALVELGCSASDKSFVAIRALKPFLDLLQTAKVDNIIKQSERAFWLNPFTYLQGLIQNEETWCNFLTNTFKSLSEKAYQVDDKKYKTWWNSNHPISTTDINSQKLKTFFSYFAGIPAVASLSYSNAVQLLKQESVNKLTSLNVLLDLTLLSKLDCKTSSNVCDCRGTYVSLKEANSLCKPYYPKQLVLSAYHSIFIDEGIVGSDYSTSNNLDIILVSPFAWNTNQFTINLSGVTAAAHGSAAGSSNALAGNPGGKAGNFYSIVENYSSPINAVSVQGGKGGKGQVGQRGTDGQKGSMKKPSWDSGGIITHSECGAWSGGTVKLHSPTPNSCASPNGDRCNAGNSGVRYTVPGYSGTSGGSGGNGGKAGLGGKGGSIYKGDFASSQVSVVRGSDGTQGDRGEGGQGGTGGLTGDTFYIYIDDVNSGGQKRCKRLSDSWSSVSTRASGGYAGTAGGSSLAAVSPISQTFNPSSVVPSIISNYKSASNFLKSNEFFKSSITAFHSKISNIKV